MTTRFWALSLSPHRQPTPVLRRCAGLFCAPRVQTWSGLGVYWFRWLTSEMCACGWGNWVHERRRKAACLFQIPSKKPRGACKNSDAVRSTFPIFYSWVKFRKWPELRQRCEPWGQGERLSLANKTLGKRLPSSHHHRRPASSIFPMKCWAVIATATTLGADEKLPWTLRDGGEIQAQFLREEVWPAIDASSEAAALIALQILALQVYQPREEFFCWWVIFARDARKTWQGFMPFSDIKSALDLLSNNGRA